MSRKSNAELFGSYQRKVELLARKTRHLLANPVAPEHTAFARLELWAERYEARRQCLQDANAADRAGLDLVMRRNAEAAPQPPIPVDRETIEAFEGIRSLDGPAPHAFGPSLRKLWWKNESWAGLEDWLTLQPSLAAEVPVECATPVTWNAGWTADVNGASWAVELGDFPDEPLYRLLVNGQAKGSMQDWPEAWTRPEGPGWKAAPAPAAKKVAVPKDIDAAKLAERYRNGECEAVWLDLLRLGEAVSKAPYRKAAQEVCDEMARRSLHNVQLLFERLHAMGYEFWSDEQRQRSSLPCGRYRRARFPGCGASSTRKRKKCCGR